MHGLKLLKQRFTGSTTPSAGAAPDKEKRLSDQGGPSAPRQQASSSHDSGQANATAGGSGQGVQLLPVGGASVQMLPAGTQPWEGQNAQRGPSATSETRRSRPVNLAEIKDVLQQLTGVNVNPTIGLAEAAELLCTHLGVALVSIIGSTEGLASYILLAAHGTGAAELERDVVMKGADWSPFQLEGRHSHLYLTAEDDDQALALPKDWAVLYHTHGLRSFLAVPIVTANETLGLLTVAKQEPHAFDDDWWEPMLGVLSVGLLPHLRNDQVSHLCHLVRVLDGTSDYLALVALLLQGAHRMLLKTTNIKMGVRLGLLNQDQSKALIFEVDPSKIAADDAPLTHPRAARAGAPGADGAPGGGTADITITEIDLDNTLLLDAVNKGKARFVSDCASYLQSCMKPATDIFISATQMVASIVVLPLIYGNQTLGGLYFMLETPSNFQNIKDMLMGFVNSIVLLLYQKLEGQLQQMWEMVVQQPLALNGMPLEPQQNPGSQGAPGGAPASLPAALQPQPAGPGPGEGASLLGLRGAGGAGEGGSFVHGDGSSAVSKKMFSKRSCTEAMLKVLQHEIRKTHARAQNIEWVDELVLMETIGKGGFGMVYKGTWKGSVAAIKVMYARQHERQAMKDALEMAVLTTVSHPNIIQVYSCFTDMVEDAGTAPEDGVEGRINVRFRRLHPDEDKSLATCNIVVMEYCDKGSLRHALKRGVFHKRLGNTSVAVDLCAIVQVLIEVAQSVLHLHNMKLLHCDIKPENVLLKSDSTNPLGFVTKLSDFGLAKLLRENYYIINRSGSGTVTHLAPELFQVGSKITTAVDTFSFGIMMWELYTGQRAYSGLGRDAIIDRVYKKQSRPVFPAGVPLLYSQLARGCWENEPHLRPAFPVILSLLHDMLAAFQSGSYAGAGAAADAIHERAVAGGAPAGAGAAAAAPPAGQAAAGGGGGAAVPAQQQQQAQAQAQAQQLYGGAYGGAAAYPQQLPPAAYAHPQQQPYAQPPPQQAQQLPLGGYAPAAAAGAPPAGYAAPPGVGVAARHA